MSRTERPEEWEQPTGRKLAYFREDGSFGIRDLRTGQFQATFEVDRDGRSIVGGVKPTLLSVVGSLL